MECDVLTIERFEGEQMGIIWPGINIIPASLCLDSALLGLSVRCDVCCLESSKSDLVSVKHENYKYHQTSNYYFTLVINKNPTHSNDHIHKSLNNKFTLANLEFLSYQLERFNSFNLLFQSAKPLLQGLKDEVESLIKSIASDFMVID